ncbi:MAG: AtpZ/AtpI family protein [Hydrotalea sp.]|nr:AtpZ/AtpI family protein [Hydrotalea sp.]
MTKNKEKNRYLDDAADSMAKSARESQRESELLTERLGRLKKSVDAHQLPRRLAKKNNEINETDSGADSYGYGVTMALEMFVTLAVGVGFGWGLDKWLGTRPWLTIILGFLGILAGIINVIRITTPRKQF